VATRKRSPSKSFSFRAKILRRGASDTTYRIYSVELPATVSRAIGVKGTVPVIGTVDGTPFRTSLIPVKTGRHRIWLNRAVRAAAGVAQGDRVAVVLRVDDDPPREVTPADLVDVLGEEGVFEAFEAMSPGRRNHILRWVEQAVHEATRARRLARCVEIATGLHERALDREAAGPTRRGG
jgi:hypothetical protein